MGEVHRRDGRPLHQRHRRRYGHVRRAELRGSRQLQERRQALGRNEGLRARPAVQSVLAVPRRFGGRHHGRQPEDRPVADGRCPRAGGRLAGRRCPRPMALKPRSTPTSKISWQPGTSSRWPTASIPPWWKVGSPVGDNGRPQPTPFQGAAGRPLRPRSRGMCRQLPRARAAAPSTSPATSRRRRQRGSGGGRAGRGVHEPQHAHEPRRRRHPAQLRRAGRRNGCV